MNADDILTRASSALRERAREPSTAASRTRALVLLRASRRAQRGKLLVSLAPLAAVFAISTAWASTHQELPRAWDRVLGLFASKGAGTSAPAHAGIATAVVRPVAIAATAAPPDERESTAAPEVSIDALPQASPSSSLSPLERRAEPPAPYASSRVVREAAPDAVIAQARPAAPLAVPHEDDEARLYAEAHRAHFVDGDPSSALQAWNAYLTAAPEGTFAPEARYNRAVTLVRLGRLDEARRALEPFARGVYGGYRTREAAALLDAIALHAR